MNGSSDELLRDLFVLFQPMRWKIVKVLKEAGEPLYIKEIAKRLNEDWKKVSFHLSKLADSGFVVGEFRSIERPSNNPGYGRAGKFYKLTKKVDEVLSRLEEISL